MFIIRQYQCDDLGDVLCCWENASKIAHPFFSREFIEQERSNISYVALPGVDTWVSEHMGRVVGFISLVGSDVGAMFVQPDFHGMGIGRALMHKARELHSELEVEVFEDNLIGRKFYIDYGFEPLSKKIHDETGYELIRLKFTDNEPLSAR